VWEVSAAGRLVDLCRQALKSMNVAPTRARPFLYWRLLAFPCKMETISGWASKASSHLGTTDAGGVVLSPLGWEIEDLWLI